MILEVARRTILSRCGHQHNYRTTTFHHVPIKSILLMRRQSCASMTTTTTTTVATKNISEDSTSANSTNSTNNNNRTTIISSPPPVEDEILGPTNKQQPKIIFPWRHESLVLDRLRPDTLDYTIKGQLLSTTKLKPGNSTMNGIATAYMFLDVPWYELLFFTSWKAELADSMAWAFTQGVAGILSNLYHVPVENITKGDYDIDFRHEIDHSTTMGKLKSGIVEDKLASFYESTAGSSAATTTSASPNNDPSTTDDSLNGDTTITTNDSNDENKVEGRFAIHLQLQAYEAELISLYAIPYISRTNSKSNPILLANYRKMLEKPPVERAPELSKLRNRYLDSGTMESTIIAQVLVWCNEVFFIKDLSTGKIIQGSGVGEEGKEEEQQEADTTTTTTTLSPKSTTTDDGEGGGGEEISSKTTPTIPTPKKIPHLVRMEMTVKTRKGMINDRGNWIITDIDDHLDGNLVV